MIPEINGAVKSPTAVRGNAEYEHKIGAAIGAVRAIYLPGRLQEKSVSPSETAQTVGPDAGYEALSQVSVGAIPSDYVGSAVTRDPTMTASGKTVTAPAGYYTEPQTKNVADGALADPAISVSAGGLITAQASVGTAGYLAAGSSKSKTQQLSTQAGKTVTPSNVEQIAVEAGKYVTGDIKVAPQSSGPDTSDATATASDIAYGKTAYIADGSKATGNVTERDFTDLVDLTPTALGGGVSAPAGIYRTAAAKRDAQLVAANVRYGKTIFGVSGSYTQIASGAAAAGDIVSGKMAYANGSLITGSLVVPTPHIEVLTKTLSSMRSSISFTGLLDEPDFFAVVLTGDYSSISNPNYVVGAVTYDGTNKNGVRGNGAYYASISTNAFTGFTFSYSNGTLDISISASSTYFAGGSYKLIYGYVA